MSDQDTSTTEQRLAIQVNADLPAKVERPEPTPYDKFGGTK